MKSSSIRNDKNSTGDDDNYVPISNCTGAPRDPTAEELFENIHAVPARISDRTRKLHEQRCRDLFKVFEKPAGSGGCDVRDVGSLVRGLGLNPKEATVLAMIEAAEETESQGSIKFERLLPVLMQALTERQYAGQILERESESGLRRALAAIASSGTIGGSSERDWLDADVVRELLSRSGRGEPLSADETDRMLNSIVDPVTGRISIDDYVSLLMGQ